MGASGRDEHIITYGKSLSDDPLHYYDKFIQQWGYIQTYLIDHVHGDWYEEGLDREPPRKTALKGPIWKETYDHFRALSNCEMKLRDAVEDLKQR